MKWAVVIALLIAIAALGYGAPDRQIYEQGINLNFKLVAVIGGAVVLAAVLFVVLRRKKAS